MDGPQRLECREHIEGGRVAVGIASLGEQLGLLASVATDEEADQLKQHVGRQPQRVVLDQGLAERLAADGKVRRRAHRGQHRIGQRRVVGGQHTETVAGAVGDAARRDVEDDVARVFLRPGSVQSAGGTKHGLDGKLAAVAGRACGLGRNRRRSLGWNGRRLFQKALEHAARVLAAGHAQVQLGFLACGDGGRVGLAQIAALAAVLLGHGRKQLARHWPGFSQFHALVDHHGRVVPRRAIIFVAGERLGRGARQIALERRDLSLERQHAGEEAVEPGTLLRREGCALGNQRCPCGLRVLDRHATGSSASIMDLSAAASCRRLNSRNVSAGCARWAR